MDKKKILDKYKNKKDLRKTIELKGGRDVIGTEVDEENHLYYVIRKGKKLSLERANSKDIKRIYWHKESFPGSVENKKD